jgi:hypothetical protein
MRSVQKFMAKADSVNMDLRVDTLIHVFTEQWFYLAEAEIFTTLLCL